MIPNNLIVLSSPRLDGGNTGANVYAFVLPLKIAIDRVVVTTEAVLTSNLHVSCDSYVGTTQGAEDIASIELAASAVIFEAAYDEVAKGTVLKAGDAILVQVDNAGDSGENFQVHVVCKAYDERPDNMTGMLESA